MLPTYYRGSVKNVAGPIKFQFPYWGASAPRNVSGVVFQYTDSFSVFDWGKMPQLLTHKGEALAIMACAFFEKLGRAETWQAFSKTPEAMALRKGVSQIVHDGNVQEKDPMTGAPISLGSTFNDIGEKLQKDGLETHYLGAVSDEFLTGVQVPDFVDVIPLKEMRKPPQAMAVRQVKVTRPVVRTVLGHSVLDYQALRQSRNGNEAILVPLEVVFRFSCPPGSSLLERVKRNPDYLSSLAIPGGVGSKGLIEEGVRWEFPVIELFTKLESTDRPVTFTEALAISGLEAQELQNILLKTAWVAGWLKSEFSKIDLDLADGKLEWGLSAQGKLFLVDAIGPDELRILPKGEILAHGGDHVLTQLSKEFLRDYYRKTPWYDQVKEAKAHAASKGTQDWKSFIKSAPPELPQDYLETASQLYMSLANALTGQVWFKEAWPISQVIEKIKRKMGA